MLTSDSVTQWWDTAITPTGYDDLPSLVKLAGATRALGAHRSVSRLSICHTSNERIIGAERIQRVLTISGRRAHHIGKGSATP